MHIIAAVTVVEAQIQRVQNLNSTCSRSVTVLSFTSRLLQLSGVKRLSAFQGGHEAPLPQRPDTRRRRVQHVQTEAAAEDEGAVSTHTHTHLNVPVHTLLNLVCFRFQKAMGGTPSWAQSSVKKKKRGRNTPWFHYFISVMPVRNQNDCLCPCS